MLAPKDANPRGMRPLREGAPRGDAAPEGSTPKGWASREVAPRDEAPKV